MPEMLVRHKIADYAKWKPVFDAHAPAQKAAGLTGGRLFRNADDPQEVLILFEAEDIEKAQRFVKSEDTKAAMARGGVIDVPDVAFLEEIEAFKV